MLSFYCYKQILEYLNGSGRQVIVQVLIKTKRGQRVSMRVPFDEIKPFLDSDMDIIEYRDKPIKFKDIHGQFHTYSIHSYRFFLTHKVEIHSRNSEKVLVFKDFVDVVEYMQSHGKKIVVVISIWTHHDPRLVLQVDYNEMKKHLNERLALVHVRDGDLTFKTTDGQNHSYKHNNLRIAKFDHILIT